MADAVYTTVPGKIPTLLNKVKDVGVPPKVTVGYLKTIGFTSSNDKSLMGVLRLINFIDASGIPTKNWQLFRGPNGKAALAECIRAGYGDLFAVYPDADTRSNTELEQVFSQSTKAGKQAISKIVSTFKNLSSQADFGAAPVSTPSTAEDVHVAVGPLHKPVAAQVAPAAALSAQGGPSLHIDMQIHISPEASADQIDQIFASMSKHLYGKK